MMNKGRRPLRPVADLSSLSPCCIRSVWECRCQGARWTWRWSGGVRSSSTDHSRDPGSCFNLRTRVGSFEFLTSTTSPPPPLLRRPTLHHPRHWAFTIRRPPPPHPHAGQRVRSQDAAPQEPTHLFSERPLLTAPQFRLGLPSFRWASE